MELTELRERLFALQDDKYRQFQCKLMPTVEPDTVIGVRTPYLRKLAKELRGTGAAREFMKALPHAYYDENNLHGCLICEIKDFDECARAVNAFLPYVDNWATCDMLSPKALKRDPERLLSAINGWLASARTYAVRFGIGMLMSHFLDDWFAPEYLEIAARIRSDEYYVNMMTAWFFATALAKQYEAALPYIEQARLDTWTHNKAIQKAIESARVPPARKDELRGLKIQG